MLYRASESIEAVGRTLEGVAFYFDKPSTVRDAKGPAYREAFTRASVDKTMSERAGKWPVGMFHPWAPGARTSPIPLGAVEFERSGDALKFRAKISETQAGDEALALVNDGALNDVSIGFRSIQSMKRGDVLYRTEIALIELSLAPTGLGQHEGAQVLAVRSTPALDRLRRRKSLLLLEV